MVRERVNASEGESDLHSSVSFANKMRDRVETDHIRKRLNIQSEENWFQDGTLGNPKSKSEGYDLISFTVTTCDLSCM